MCVCFSLFFFVFFVNNFNHYDDDDYNNCMQGYSGDDDDFEADNVGFTRSAVIDRYNNQPPKYLDLHKFQR